MNLLDALVVEDALEDAKIDGGLKKIRASVNSIYDKIEREDAEQNDDMIYRHLSAGAEDDMIDEAGLPGFAPVS